MVRSTRRANPFCGPGCEPGRWPVVPAPDFQSGGAGFQTRGNPVYKLRGFSPGGCFSIDRDFFRSLAETTVHALEEVRQYLIGR
jgi:hypothetical protein